MSKNRILIGIILSIFLLIFSINGFTAYYKYTQESGADFYVGIADKSDALEDTNEIRRIVDDLGNLLVHSKRNDLYPKDGSAGGTLAIPNSALVSFATGTKGDLFYCSSTNVWVKLNIGSDNQILVVATDLPNWETVSSDLLSDVAFIAMLDEAETITANWVNTAFPWADNEVADNITCSNYYLKTEIDTLGEVETIYAANIIDNTELAAALGAYYLKTAIDTIGEVETIWGKNITDSDELASALALYYLKTTIDTQGEMEAIWSVSLANDSELHDILTLGSANGLSLDGQELSLTVNSDTSAGAVSSGAGQDSKVWKTNAAGVPDWREDDTTALTTFIALTDTPANYTGQGGKIVKVAGTEDALEFIAMPGGGDVLGPATSVDHSVARFAGTDNKTIQDSLMTINDDGSVNIPLGETYKINNVALAYGNITGAAGSGANTNITSLTGLTTPLGLAYGGTGSVSASGARTALGLVYGVNVQAYDAGLLSLAGLTYASPSFIKVTANDTYAIRTLAEVKQDLDLEIGTDVLAQQTIGIANNNLVEMDDADAADNDIPRFTPNGLEGRSYSELRIDLSIQTAYADSFATGGAGTSGDPWTGDCIQAAIDSITTGVVFLNPGYYQPTTDAVINLKGGITLQGVKGYSIIDAEAFSTAVFVIDAEGSEESSIAATANITTGDKTITVGDTSSLTAGDYVRIASDEDWMAGYDCGEIQQIRVIDDSNNFTLYNPVWDDYTTANNARVYEVHFLDNIVVDGITILRGGVDNGYGMRFKHVRNSTVQNCMIDAADGRGIVFDEVLYSNIHNNYVLDTNKTELGYAIFIMNASQFNNITNNFIKRARRCISFGGTSIPAGLPRFNNIEGNYFTGSAEQTTPFLATHELCEHLKIIDNIFVGDGARAGISIESNHTLISGNFFQDCTQSIVLHTESFYATVQGNYIFNGTAGIYIRGGSASEARYFNISDNFIKATAGISFLRYDSSATTFQEIYIKNNIINASSYFIRGDDASVTLENCLIFGNTTYGKPNLHIAVLNPGAFKVDVIQIKYDLGLDHSYNGRVEIVKAGENVVFGQICYHKFSDNEWYLAKADVIETTPGMRIALESKGDGEDCLMLIEGYIRDDSAFDFGDSRIYLNDDTAGACDDTAPAESGDMIQLVGIGISADILDFNPSIDVGKI